MLFSERQNLRLLNVLHLHYENDTDRIDRQWRFCGLSYRFRADTDLTSKGVNHHLTDRTLTYFPPYSEYERHTKIDDMIVIHFDTSEDVADELTVLDDIDRDRMEQLFREILRVWSNHADNYYYEASAIFYRIVSLIRSNVSNDARTDPVVRQACDFLDVNALRADFRIEEVARAVGVSETGLRNRFRKALGESPKQYATHVRMTRAVNLLNSGYYTVVEVAEAVGYSDAKNFSTAFRTHFGYPPSKQHYR